MADSGAGAAGPHDLIWKLPDELVAVAERDLGETPDKREEALDDLRAKVATLPDREKFDSLNDEVLVRYLRARKFNVERTLDVLTNLQKFKVDNPRWFEKLRADIFAHQYATGYMRVLAAPDKLGRRVVLVTIRKIPPDIEIMESVRMNMWMFERLSRDPYYQVNGVVFVEDFAGLQLPDYIRLSNMADVSLKIKGLHYMQKCAPFRMKGLYMLNEPILVKGIFQILRPFMAKKLSSRIHFMGGDVRAVTEELFEEGKIPKELGGTYEEEPMAWFDAQRKAEQDEMGPYQKRAGA